MPNKLSQFWQELKRRRVIHVIVVYATAAFVILEFIDIIGDPFGLPDWTLKLVFVLLCVGLVLSIIFSWIYDMTPEGLEKTRSSREVPEEERKPAPNSWRIATYVCVVIILGLIAFNIFGGKRGSGIDESLAKTVAVLPFENMSDDPEYRYFGDAMTDEIIMQLYKINEFTVRSRTSVMQYKGTQKTIPVIGEELMANYLVEGSAQRFEDRVRIRVQLINAQTDDHLWGEVYEYLWKDILSLQSRIARQIANELQTVLSPEEISRIEKEPTNNLEAYEFYLKGEQARAEMTEEGANKALDFYNKAISIDPDYALAYVGLSQTYNVIATYSDWTFVESLEMSYEAAEKALSLNDNLAEAHAILGTAKKDYFWDLHGAEIELLKAIEFNANYAFVYEEYAELLYYSTDRFEEALEMAKRGVALDPRSAPSHNIYALALFHNNQADSAISYLKHRIEIDPEYAFIYETCLGVIYAKSGRYLQAVEVLENVSPCIQWCYSYLGEAYVRAGMPEKTEDLLEGLEGLSEEQYIGHLPSLKAVFYSALGEKDSALYWFNRTYEEKSKVMLWTRSDTLLFSSIRSEPAFQEIYNELWHSTD